MKKFLSGLILLCLTTSVFAEGYQVNMLSARQTGMGHMGAALKLGAESQHFNPAGMGFLDKSVDISAGISGIHANSNFEDANSDYSRKSNNGFSTPFYIYAGYSIYDNFKAGISLTTPYGSSMTWSKTWKGAELIQDISLKAYVLQPTVAYKITDNLSIGAGLMVAKGSVELSKALLPVGFLTHIGMGEEYADVVPASATLNGTTDFSYGYNIGIQYDVCKKLTVGFSYRSKVTMKVKEGEIKLDVATDAIKSKVPPLSDGTFHAKLPLPYNWNIGIAYKPTEKWLISAEYQRIGWSAYDSLNVYFNQKLLQKYDILTRKGYSDTYILRLGAQYTATERCDVRAGFYYDTAPIDKNNYNPETPGMTKLGFSGGLSFKPTNHLSVDCALLIIVGTGIDGSCTYKNGVTGATNTFAGHYDAFAYAPTLGLSYSF